MLSERTDAPMANNKGNMKEKRGNQKPVANNNFLALEFGRAERKSDGNVRRDGLLAGLPKTYPYRIAPARFAVSRAFAGFEEE